MKDNEMVLACLLYIVTQKVLENVLEMLQKFYIPVFLREGRQNYLLESLQGF